jgi:very-short-patch-repair endonuclease
MDPELQRRRRERLGVLNRDPDKQRTTRAYLDRLWAEPAWRVKWSEAQKNSPKVRDYHQRQRDDPSWKARQSHAQKNSLKARLALARLHADPEILAKICRTQNPSRDELALRSVLSDSFIHTGQDFTRSVGGYLPDYQDSDRKLVIEYDGHYVHWGTQRGQIKEDRRDAKLAVLGWRVLHVYPWEMKDLGTLRVRIVEFSSPIK